jgi:Fe2+ transport system protein FeoA
MRATEKNNLAQRRRDAELVRVNERKKLCVSAPGKYVSACRMGRVQRNPSPAEANMMGFAPLYPSYGVCWPWPTTPGIGTCRVRVIEKNNLAQRRRGAELVRVNERKKLCVSAPGKYVPACRMGRVQRNPSPAEANMMGFAPLYPSYGVCWRWPTTPGIGTCRMRATEKNNLALRRRGAELVRVNERKKLCVSAPGKYVPACRMGRVQRNPSPAEANMMGFAPLYPSYGVCWPWPTTPGTAPCRAPQTETVKTIKSNAEAQRRRE